MKSTYTHGVGLTYDCVGAGGNGEPPGTSALALGAARRTIGACEPPRRSSPISESIVGSNSLPRATSTARACSRTSRNPTKYVYTEHTHTPSPAVPDSRAGPQNPPHSSSRDRATVSARSPVRTHSTEVRVCQERDQVTAAGTCRTITGASRYALCFESERNSARAIPRAPADRASLIAFFSIALDDDRALVPCTIAYTTNTRTHTHMHAHAHTHTHDGVST